MKTENISVERSLLDYSKEKVVELIRETDAELVRNFNILCEEDSHGVKIAITVSKNNVVYESDTEKHVSNHCKFYARLCFNVLEVDEVFYYAKSFIKP